MKIIVWVVLKRSHSSAVGENTNGGGLRVSVGWKTNEGAKVFIGLEVVML
ncbi:MAG: hypothetical protein ABIX01_18035 [Chitinophagaceae bacterium]